MGMVSFRVRAEEGERGENAYQRGEKAVEGSDEWYFDGYRDFMRFWGRRSRNVKTGSKLRCWYLPAIRRWPRFDVQPCGGGSILRTLLSVPTPSSSLWALQDDSDEMSYLVNSDP